MSAVEEVNGAKWLPAGQVSGEVPQVVEVALRHAKELDALRARVAELERIIEDAPHADYCGAPSSSGAEVYKCKCWKAEALRQMEKADEVLDDAKVDYEEAKAKLDAAIDAARAK